MARGSGDRRPARPCVFCAIVRGEAQSYPVFEGESSLAFLDLRPLFPGHCLLVPREHYHTLADLPAGVVAAVFADVRLVALGVERALEAEGTFVAINNRVSQSVPHLHVHIVPRRRKDGLRGFFWPRRRYPDEDAIRAVQARLRSAIGQVLSSSREGGRRA